MTGEPRDWTAEVIADGSVQGLSPQGWAERVVALARAYGADRLVAEGNQGGALVEQVIRQVDGMVPIRMVHARDAKGARAEPVAALYEQGRITHRAEFRELEDEMALMTVGGFAGSHSPDRVDALVWAITELMIEGSKNFIPRIRSF